jgi:hypothetical protein
MGNHDVGRSMASAAEVFWTMVPEGTAPTKEQAMKALDAAGRRFRGADAEFEDELVDHTTPLGRMVAIAFEATPEEMDVDPEGEAWYEGPYTRFRDHFEFC